MSAAWLSSPVVLTGMRMSTCGTKTAEECAWYRKRWHFWYVDSLSLCLGTMLMGSPGTLQTMCLHCRLSPFSCARLEFSSLQTSSRRCFCDTKKRSASPSGGKVWPCHGTCRIAGSTSDGCSGTLLPSACCYSGPQERYSSFVRLPCVRYLL